MDTLRDSVEVSVIVPTLNEAENLPLLVPRIATALSGRSYEILIVDDNSSDDTKSACAGLSAQYPLTLHVRAEPHAGLSGAVLEGMRLARGRILLVMDADLQHPPEQIPQLIDRLGSADFVLGSRYAPGGSTTEKWGPFRRLNSRIATFLARPFSGNTLDPMSGFFALRRETLERAERLTPLGYKIGLELMCKCRVRRVEEVPIHFSRRARGISKLTLTQQFRYLEHLSRLYDFTFPRLSPVIKFLIATACSWFVALGLYGLLLMAGIRPLAAIAASYPAAILVTAVFHLRYVRTQREFLATPRPWRDFFIISLAEWAACLLCAWWIARRVSGIHVLELFVITFAAATVVRYILRKEFLQDIRGLRREVRKDELSETPAEQAESDARQAPVTDPAPPG